MTCMHVLLYKVDDTMFLLRRAGVGAAERDSGGCGGAEEDECGGGYGCRRRCPLPQLRGSGGVVARHVLRLGSTSHALLARSAVAAALAVIPLGVLCRGFDAEVPAFAAQEAADEGVVVAVPEPKEVGEARVGVAGARLVPRKDAVRDAHLVDGAEEQHLGVLHRGPQRRHERGVEVGVEHVAREEARAQHEKVERVRGHRPRRHARERGCARGVLDVREVQLVHEQRRRVVVPATLDERAQRRVVGEVDVGVQMHHKVVLPHEGQARAHLLKRTPLVTRVLTRANEPPVGVREEREVSLEQRRRQNRLRAVVVHHHIRAAHERRTPPQE
mmetsp:Transcript_27758/g.90841  ORF Transcript_27758/g.90841 Transcript_27758/m.90841 type:complete len:330 (-) Transcript_27758:191-1180(-)